MGILDDHNPYPSIPAPADSPPMPGVAAALGLLASLLWLFGFGSIIGVAAGLYARLQCDDGWPRRVGTAAVALGGAGIVVALWIGVVTFM